MARSERQKHQRRKALHEVLDRLEPALRQLNGLTPLNRHLAATEDVVFEVLAGSLELAQGEFAKSYSRLRTLAAANSPHTSPD